MNTFKLPNSIVELLKARNSVRAHYHNILLKQGSEVDLQFTFDGNLVGDIGEAIAVELFGIKLVDRKSTEGIDGKMQNGLTVQVKATGTKRGPAFRKTKTHAEHLLFFCLDFEKAVGIVAYNGPENLVRSYLPENQIGQRMISRSQILAADGLVSAEQRLPRIDLK